MSIEDTIRQAVREAIDAAVPRAVEQALRDRLPKPAKPAANDDRMTAHEVARRFKRDVTTVRRWARQKRIPAKHLNGQLLFRKEDVDAFEAAGGAACDNQAPNPNVIALRILKER